MEEAHSTGDPADIRMQNVYGREMNDTGLNVVILTEHTTRLAMHFVICKRCFALVLFENHKAHDRACLAEDAPGT